MNPTDPDPVADPQHWYYPSIAVMIAPPINLTILHHLTWTASDGLRVESR